jgi:diguanylate cyclase (GGDEF)-like protein
MRRILETCVEMDRLALDTYGRVADAVTDPDLAEIFRLMARDEAEHVGWWDELLVAWDNGLLPDIAGESERLNGALHGMLDEMLGLVPRDGSPMSNEDALTVATKLEFFMLDPCFGEFLDLMEPAIAMRRHEQYAEHLERLIGAIENHYEADSLPAFLARVLRRTWRDNRLLSSFTMRDPLTGLPNRRAFNAQLRQWTAWAARYGRPLAVVLVDIDDFRSLNQASGYAAGDAALMAVSNALVQSLRDSDLVARFGGDEFAILAPETGRETLLRLSERILDTVRSIHTEEGRVHVTVSIGAVLAEDHEGADARTLEELLAAADQALFAAKTNGRDRAAAPVVLSRG